MAEPAGKTRRTRSRLTIKLVAEALKATGGIQSLAAQRLFVDRSNIHRFIKKHDSLRVLIADLTDEVTDIAEGHLMVALRKGEQWAVKLWLKERGQSRGYGMRKLAFRDDDGTLHAPPGILISEGRMTPEEWEATDWAKEAQDAIDAEEERKALVVERARLIAASPTIN